MDAQSHINVTQFEELRDLLEEDFIDLINTYVSDSEQRLEDMQSAFNNADNRLGFDMAHSLKGASSNLGATQLTELCYKLQEICRHNEIHKYQQLIDEIKAECHAVNSQIKSLIS